MFSCNIMIRSLTKVKHLKSLYKHNAYLSTITANNTASNTDKRCFSINSSLHFPEALTESYVQGGPVTLLKETLGDLIDDATERFPHNEAVICYEDKTRLTYVELQEKINQVAAGLIGLGLQKGDRVGVWGQNHMEWVLAFFAISNAGLIAVNINPAFKSGELDYALNKVRVNALFLMSSFKDSDYYAILKEVAPEIDYSTPGTLNAERVPHLRHVIMTEGPSKLGTFSFQDVLQNSGFDEVQKLKAIRSESSCDDIVNIQFTSGTTGNPKGALLSHHNLVNNANITKHLLEYNETSKICISVPLFHCFGLVLGSMAALAAGGTQVFPARGFKPEMSLKAIHDERCNSVYGTPAMFIDKLNHPNFNQYDFTSLETGIMAGSPCPIEVMNQVIERLHVKDMTIVYGLTETSPGVTITPRTSPVIKRTTSVGQVFPDIEIKLIDTEGNIVPTGQPGELCARGHCVFQGYWEDDKKTKEAIDEYGWFHSGDISEMGEDGYIKIVGRIKDVIIRGGENIYPTEVENFLYKHPKIADVQLVGVPDDRLGEEVCAWIKLKENSECTVEEIKSFCKGKIAHYKVPRYIDFVDSYPMTISGKIKKYVIRDEMIKRLKEERGK